MKMLTLAGILVLSNAAFAVQTLKCSLEEVKIEIGVDGDVLKFYSILAEDSVEVVNGSASIEKFNDKRFYFSAYLRGDNLKVFIRDKVAMGALTSKIKFDGEAEFHLSDPGPYTEPGLQLVCSLK